MDSKLMPRNEGRLDRILRVALGLALASLLYAGPVPGWGLFGLVGLVLLATGFVGSCPVYTLLGLRTGGRVG